MRARAVIVVLAVVAVSGCGGEPRLSASAADELHAQVAAVRETARDGDRDAALGALDRLAARVRELRADGALAEADAAALRRGVAQAKRRVREEVAAPVAAPTATATPEPTAEPPGEPGTGNDDEKGKGETEGKGKGHDKEKGKDE